MGEMDGKLRSMRVNMDQRKRLMAAGRFGIGPLVQMGMVEKKEYPETLPLATLGAAKPLMPVGPQPNPTAGESERRKQAFNKLHQDEEGLEDLNAFLAPKRRPPVSRDKGEDTTITKKLVTRLAPKPPSQEEQAVVEPILSPVKVRATASTAGARPKAAAFRAKQGPTIEEVRQMQTLYPEHAPQEKFNWTQALEAAIEELRMEEVRRARKEERKRRDEWRKTWKEEKRRKTGKVKAAKQGEEEEDEASAHSCSGCSEDSGDSSKRRRFKEGGLFLKQMDEEQRKFWGETVKGRVSNVNKGFTDADLEQRFKSQQAAIASENLMTESQVLALMSKEKGKEKVKRKEKPDAIDRSRERRRRSSSRSPQ